MKLLFGFVITLACFSSNVLSQQLTLNSPTLLTLAEHPYWHQLLKYKANGKKVKSEVSSAAFFLAPDGDHNPLSELNANISALFNNETIDNTHPRCQFVERFNWLNSRLNLVPNEDALSQCTAFNQWARVELIESASLVYASGYLGNPASFFGHILLKLNYPQNISGSNQLLDISINFGAAIPPEDNTITYVFKGFFGGYFAAFKEDSFFRHHYNYAEQESRSLWEYKLALDKSQLHSLVRHLWELKNQKFDYYYLNDNCASRMAELVSMITEQNLSDERFPWAQPITAFNKLHELNNQGIRSIDAIEKHPSRFDLFFQQYQTLSDAEREVLVEIDKQKSFASAQYASLKEIEKIQIVNTLLEYYEYQLKLGVLTAKVDKKRVTKERFKLSPGHNRTYTVKEQPPHKGHLPVLGQMGVSINQQSVYSGILRFRPTYYDLLSIETGRLKNSSLAMGDVEFEISEAHGARLKYFDLANILTLSPKNTILESESSLAWKIRFGLESNNECYQCLNPNIELGLGKSSWFGDSLVYGFPELRFKTQSDQLNRISLASRIGLIHEFSDNWKSQLEWHQIIDGFNPRLDYGSKWQVSWNNRFGSSRHQDMRLNVLSNDVNTQLEIRYSMYW